MEIDTPNIMNVQAGTRVFNVNLPDAPLEFVGYASHLETDESLTVLKNLDPGYQQPLYFVVTTAIFVRDFYVA